MSDFGVFLFGWAGLSCVVWALPAAAERLLGRRLGPGFRTALWLAVLIRAAVPFGPVPLAWPTGAAAVPAVQVPTLPGAGSTAAVVPVPVPADQGGLSEPLVWTCLWLLGTTGLAAAGFASRRRWALARQTSRPLPPDLAALAAAEAPGIPVRLMDGLSSPCVAGWPRPTIYLPADVRASGDELRWMLLHEAAHVRRGDLAVLAGARFLTHVFWFLPGLWLAARRLEEALEAGCDARTLGRAGEADRLAYGRVLLDLLGAPGRRRAPAPAMASGFAALRRRMKAIRRPAGTTGGALVLILAALTVGSVWGLPVGAPPAPGWPFAPGTSAWVTLGYGPVAPEMGLRITDHRGIDLAARSGTPVLAPWAGTVEAVGFNDEDGNLVVLDLGGGWKARLTHLKAPASVAAGDRVAAGRALGLVGSTGVSTGPHVHLEVLRDGVPTDPAPFLSP